MILDHQDCGAYASKISSNLSQDPKQEKQIHGQYLHQAYHSIKKRYPNLEIELDFVQLDGKVQIMV